jgi:hypothetical protein
MPDRVGVQIHTTTSLDIGKRRLLIEQEYELGALAELEPDCALP